MSSFGARVVVHRIGRYQKVGITVGLDQAVFSPGDVVDVTLVKREGVVVDSVGEGVPVVQ